MTTLQDKIAGERRRLKQVRQKLTAAVEQTSRGNADWIPFYLSVADYMQAAMHRLHVQDEKMAAMIRDRAEGDKAVQALAELDERLQGNQQRLDRLLAERDRLADEGVARLAEFEAAARDFTDFIVKNMGHHGATTDLAGKLFSPEDWEYMAGITDEDLAREVALSEKVAAATPADLKLPEV
jgi:hypothetical protein